jgi:ubiquinone/menaquinone biosynthesis C-methylase UbiE
MTNASLTRPETEPAPASNPKLERIRAAYDRRKKNVPAGRYDRVRAAQLLILQEREQAMAALLRRSGIESLRGLRILDVGCGLGATLRQLLDYGAEPSRLFGLDLLRDRVHAARSLAPHLQFSCGNAAELPFPDGSFDLVLQFAVFTSILDAAMKQAIAREILRVLAKRGNFLWYDFIYNNPANPDVRGIRLAEIQRLFPGCSIQLRRITLAPPISRGIARFSPALYFSLAQVRPLCTHYLGLIQKH